MFPCKVCKMSSKMFIKSLNFLAHPVFRHGSTASLNRQGDLHIVINGHKYLRDEWTNVSPKILTNYSKNLHLRKNHPLSLIRQRIVDYFYKRYVGRTGNAIFSAYDNLSPIVTVKQNFDSLLIPLDHPSRSKSDCYYVNSEYLLRAHMTAHQAELIGMGLNNFLIVGDVYRRDEIDSSHYPIFHQVDAVRLCTKQEIFRHVADDSGLKIFERKGKRTECKQEVHTLEATKIMETELKDTLIGLAQSLFGKNVEYRWVETYFPFTHPSWELEVYYQEKWMEVLGCGIMEHKILQTAGAIERMGWAFGVGLERLAMCLYDIPDIRLFWSTDSGFLSQFNVSDPNTPIKYKPISIYPQCTNDISFWLPRDNSYSPNDFYDLVRCIGGDLVEQISLIDEFTHPKSQETSHCYRIVYRHMEKTLTQDEVNAIHTEIEKAAASELHVKIR